MSVYEKILALLLEESQKIGVPNEDMIKDGLVIKSPEGYEYTIKKVVKDKSGKNKYLITSDGYEEVLTYKELKQKYERS